MYGKTTDTLKYISMAKKSHAVKIHYDPLFNLGIQCLLHCRCILSLINNRMGRMSLRMGASEAGSKLWEWSMGSMSETELDFIIDPYPYDPGVGKVTN